IAPFVTEELWLSLPHDGATIMTATWPDPLEVPVDRDAAASFDMAMSTVERLRNERAENGIPDRTNVPLTVLHTSVGEYVAMKKLVAHLGNGTIPAGEDVVSELRPVSIEELLASISVQVDASARRGRLEKVRQRLLSEVERGEKKLANEAFIAKAAADVVTKEREKLEGYRAELARADEELASLKGRE
ncbi:MAG TPA: class I tRNA ligase family protein, partial [Polyangiaceae bacterium]|nr:class I tRNA ligase family protein [Polyangiaceae bacterium]